MPRRSGQPRTEASVRERGVRAADARSLHERLAGPGAPRWTDGGSSERTALGAVDAAPRQRAVKKEFGHIAKHALEKLPCLPRVRAPVRQFVEGILDVQAENIRGLRDLEKTLEDAERRAESDREKLEDCGGSPEAAAGEGNGAPSGARRRPPSARRRRFRPPAPPPPRKRGGSRILEHRLRKAEKEREHLDGRRTSPACRRPGHTRARGAAPHRPEGRSEPPEPSHPPVSGGPAPAVA